MQARHYQGPEDLYRAQAALMAWVRQCGHCNFLHKAMWAIVSSTAATNTIPPM